MRSPKAPPSGDHGAVSGAGTNVRVRRFSNLEETENRIMNTIIYIVGLVVVVGFILSVLGLL